MAQARRLVGRGLALARWLLGQWCQRRRRAADRATLSAMAPRELRDLGLGRDQIDAVLRGDSPRGDGSVRR